MEYVKITCLGGVGEIGINMYVYETENTALVVDCGIMFYNGDDYGIDYISSSLDYLKSIYSKIKAVILTHAHEDHVGFLTRNDFFLNFPIYCSVFTHDFLVLKTEDSEYKLNIITKNDKDVVIFDDIEVKFFSIYHSVPGSFGLFITIFNMNIIHLTDYKDNSKIDFTLFNEKKVDALLLDSTGSLRISDSNFSEEDIENELFYIFNSVEGKIIFTTFSSNIARITSAIRAGIAVNRKIVIVGKSMERALSLSIKQGFIDIKDEDLYSIKKSYIDKNNRYLYIVSGCQGEVLSSLYSIAMGIRKYIKIGKNDLFIFSSSLIPGNRNVDTLINNIIRLGADVIDYNLNPAIHSSGHASYKELKEIIGKIKPKYFIPIHGEYRHIYKNKKNAISEGVDEKNCIILPSGNQATFCNSSLQSISEVSYQKIYNDKRGDYELTESDLSLRKKLGKHGLIYIAYYVDILDMAYSFSFDTFGFTLDEKQSNHFFHFIDNFFSDFILLNKDPSFLSDLIEKSAKKFFMSNYNRSPLIGVRKI